MVSVDSHLHLNYNGLTQRDIIEYLGKEKIDMGWLLTWEEIKVGHWEYENLSIERAYDTYLKFPSLFVLFYAPDPHKKQASQELEDWYRKGVRGCGELKATLNWNSEEMKAFLKTVEKLKLPIVFHMEEARPYNILYSDTIFDKMMISGLRTEKKIYRIPKYFLRLLVENYVPLKNRSKSFIFPGYMLDFASLESSLKQHPNINFIAHGLMFWKNITRHADNCYETLPKGPTNGQGIIWRLLSEYSNLYADMSGLGGLNALTRDPQNAKSFLSTFEDKIMYGTDNFMKNQKDFLDSLKLTKNTYNKLYGENACRIMDQQNCLES